MDTTPAKPPRSRRSTADLLPEALAHKARAEQRLKAARENVRRLAFTAAKAGRRARSKAIIDVGLTVLLTLEIDTKLDSPETLEEGMKQFRERFSGMLPAGVEIRVPARKSG